MLKTIVATASLLLAAPVMAADVTVTVEGVKSKSGTVVVGL